MIVVVVGIYDDVVVVVIVVVVSIDGVVIIIIIMIVGVVFVCLLLYCFVVVCIDVVGFFCYCCCCHRYWGVFITKHDFCNETLSRTIDVHVLTVEQDLYMSSFISRLFTSPSCLSVSYNSYFTHLNSSTVHLSVMQ